MDSKFLNFFYKVWNLIIVLACLCRLSKSRLFISISTLIIFIDHYFTCTGLYRRSIGDY